jgi:hypothetical protein
MTSNRPTLRLWLEKLWNGSQLCMRSRTISVGGHTTNENKFAKHELVPYFGLCTTGSKSH